MQVIEHHMSLYIQGKCHAWVDSEFSINCAVIKFCFFYGQKSAKRKNEACLETKFFSLLQWDYLDYIKHIIYYYYLQVAF